MHSKVTCLAAFLLMVWSIFECRARPGPIRGEDFDDNGSNRRGSAPAGTSRPQACWQTATGGQEEVRGIL
jgi:hypothetical protein